MEIQNGRDGKTSRLAKAMDPGTGDMENRDRPVQQIIQLRRETSARLSRSLVSVALLIFGGLPSPALAADGEPRSLMHMDFAGMSLQQPPAGLGWLEPASESRAACDRERHYHPTDPLRRFYIAGVRLAWPGLVYKFLDGELFAVEGRLPDHEPAFARILDALARRYGRPDVMETWAGSPMDSFEFRHRMRTAAWFGPRNGQSLWLTAHDDGGFIVFSRTLSTAAMEHASAGCGTGPSRVDGMAPSR